MLIALAVFGYLCGSIPSGVLLARTAGLDVRQHGSGNIGATNVTRTAGPRLGILTLIADALKGALPVLVSRWIDPDGSAPAIVGICAFAGHVYPVTLAFAGGKGVATALGVSLVLYPLATIPAVIVFFGLVATTRYVSVGSVGAAVSTPIAVWWLAYPLPLLASAVVMAGLIAIRHRDNLERLATGTEPRLLLKKQATPTK